MYRRNFIKTSILGSLAFSSVSLLGCQEKSKSSYGIQLWTVKDLIQEQGIKRVLKSLSDLGFTHIENFEGSEGLFWGMSPKDFKNLLDYFNLKMPASHISWKDRSIEKAAQLASIGCEYMVCSYLGEQKSIEDYQLAAQEFNQFGEKSKSEGISFAYHNHDYSFKPLEGIIPHDILINETNPDFVDFEVDLFWLDVVNVNLEEFLAKHHQRIKLLHLKDRVHGKNESCTLGEGSINFNKLTPLIQSLSIGLLFYEQELFNKEGIWQNVKESLTFLQKNKLSITDI